MTIPSANVKVEQAETCDNCHQEGTVAVILNIKLCKDCLLCADVAISRAIWARIEAGRKAQEARINVPSTD
jgi:hypothetical protein